MRSPDGMPPEIGIFMRRKAARWVFKEKNESIKNDGVSAFLYRVHVVKDVRAKAEQTLSFALDQYFDKCEFRSDLPNTIEAQSERKESTLEWSKDSPQKSLVSNLVHLLDKYESDLNEGDAIKYWFLHYTNMLLRDLILCTRKDDFSVDEFIRGMLGLVFYNNKMRFPPSRSF